MNTRDLMAYARGGLRGHRLRTGLSLLGVAIGVAAVVLLTSLGEGARTYVTGEFASLGSNLVILVPGKTETRGAAPFVSTAANDLTLADSDALLHRIPQVRQVAPLALGVAKVRHEERSRETSILGTTFEFAAVRKIEVATGRFLPEGTTDAPVCVIGTRIQRELFPGINPLGRLIRVGEYRFRVIGVLEPRGLSIGQDLDDVVYVPVETAMRIFNRPSLFRVLIEVASHEEIAATLTKIESVIQDRHGADDVTVVTQDSVLSTFDQILRVLTLALAGIAAISLAVAGIGIMNVMLVSVSERTREIGLLKALGATRQQLAGVFLVEAALVSTTGGVLGVLVGWAGTVVIGRLYPAFPLEPPLWAVLAALFVSLTVGLIFGWLPARNASRLDPVQALMRKRG